MGSLSSGAKEERETKRETMCVRFTLIIANCLLALLGLLLLAGGGWQGGGQPQVLQLCTPRHGGSHPTRRPLRLLWGEKGEPVPFDPLQHLRLYHPPAPDRRHRVHQC